MKSDGHDRCDTSQQGQCWDGDAQPATASRSLPHLETLRSTLRRAVAKAGEGVDWEKADASRDLSAALLNMGFTSDAEGFSRASRRIRIYEAVLLLPSVALFFAAMAWFVCGFSLPLLFLAFLEQPQKTMDLAGNYVTAWIAGGFILSLCVMALRAPWDRITKVRPVAGADGSIVLSDIDPVEAVLSQRFLWIARTVSGEVEVTRIRLDAIKDVAVRRISDGAHSARFSVDAIPDRGHVSMDEYVITRLGDAEAGWLESRFADLRGIVVLTPAMA